MIKSRDYLATIGMGIGFVVAAAYGGNVMAQSGFRIETDIFVHGTAEPINQTLTLFQNGIGYDLSRVAGEDITMVDPGNDRIIRFSEATKLQTVVRISELEAMLEAVKKQINGNAQASKVLAEYLRGAGQVETAADKVTVGDKHLKYESTHQKPTDPDAAKTYSRTYRQFADATKLLNSFSGGDPPFARLALNDALDELDALPQEITITVQGKDESALKVRVHATWLLSKDDKKRIEDIHEMLVTFKEVSAAEYRKSAESIRVAAKP